MTEQARCREEWQGPVGAPRRGQAWSVGSQAILAEISCRDPGVVRSRRFRSPPSGHRAPVKPGRRPQTDDAPSSLIDLRSADRPGLTCPTRPRALGPGELAALGFAPLPLAAALHRAPESDTPAPGRIFALRWKPPLGASRPLVRAVTFGYTSSRERFGPPNSECDAQLLPCVPESWHRPGLCCDARMRGSVYLHERRRFQCVPI
jgi:hypothetical protein